MRIRMRPNVLRQPHRRVVSVNDSPAITPDSDHIKTLLQFCTDLLNNNAVAGYGPDILATEDFSCSVIFYFAAIIVNES